MIQYVIIYLAAINLISFILFGIDKRRAIKNQWRISENTLIGSAAIGGSVGALLGMRVFHHKTKHTKFKIIVPICLLVHIGIAVYFGYYLYM